MSAVIKYVREAWPEASATAEDVLGKTCKAVVGGMILGTPTWLSRKIDDWSHRTLPPATAKVVSEAIMALPFTALDFLAPPTIVVPIHVVLIVGRVIAREKGHLTIRGENASLNGLAPLNGLGLVAVIYGVANAFSIYKDTILTVKMQLAMRMLPISCGVFILDKSGFMRDCVDAASELIDKVVAREEREVPTEIRS